MRERKRENENKINVKIKRVTSVANAVVVARLDECLLFSTHTPHGRLVRPRAFHSKLS